MASDPRFLEAWVNRRDHRVFGCRLQPLSLWHILALDAINSPFLNDEAQAGAADFLQAAAILTKPVPLDLEIDPDGINPGWRLSLGAMPFSSKLREANLRLKAYFADYWSSVDVWPTENHGGHLVQAPWLLARAVYMLRHTSLTEHRIWSAPIGQMLCYAAAIEEQISGAQVISQEEQELMEELRKEAEHGRS